MSFLALSVFADAADPLSFHCRPERDANGGIHVRWPLRQGWVDYLEWSDTLEPESWQQTGVSLYGMSTSSASDPNSDAKVQVWSAPAAGSGGGTSPVEPSYTFFLQRQGNRTLVSYTVGGDNGGRQSLLEPSGNDTAYGQWHLAPTDLPVTWCGRITGFGNPYWLCLMTQDSADELPTAVEPADPAILVKLTQAKAAIAAQVAANAGSTAPAAAAAVQSGTTRFYRVRRESVDSDGSGLPDWFEWQYFGMSAFAADPWDNPGQDWDGDGLSTDEEIALGTNPMWGDSDGDGRSDADEKRDGTDPNDPNSFGPVFYYANRAAETSVDWPYSGYTPWTIGSLGSGSEEFVSALGQRPMTAAELRQFLDSVTPVPAIPQPQWQGDFSQVIIGPQWFSYQSGGYDQTSVVQTALWVQRQPAPAAPIDCDFLAIGDNSQSTSYDRYSVLTVTLPAGQTLSAPTLVDALPPWTVVHDGSSANLELYSLDPVPQVVRVNADFDEQRVDPATGFAIPDSDNTGRAEADWLRIGGTGPKAGQLCTDDLSPGFFGPRPILVARDFDLADGQVFIRKKVVIDPETSLPEPGQVRLLAVRRGIQGETDRSWNIPVKQTPTEADTDLAPLLYRYFTSPTIPADDWRTEYFYEGVVPGKVTLEFAYVSGPSSFTYTKSFLVCTQQSKKDWQEEVRQQILLQSGTDVAKLDPSRGFLTNRPQIQAVYEYYEQLQAQHPDLFLWGGLAKLAGVPVYAGLSDAQWAITMGPAISPVVGVVSASAARFFQHALMLGNLDIFSDLAWQFRAYAASGIWALRYVKDQNLGNLSKFGPTRRVFDVGPWETLWEGVYRSSKTLVEKANFELTRREQE